MDTLCVVGANKQGIALSLQFVRQGYSVLLVEPEETSIPQDIVTAVNEGGFRISRNMADIEGIPFIFLCIEAANLLGFVESAFRYLHHDVCLIIRGIVPVGTGDVLQEWLESQSKRVEVMNYPIASDAMQVLGGDALKRGIHLVRQLLSKISLPVIITNRKEAEMIPFAKSCFIAMKKSFMNQLAGLCGAMGADVITVTRILGIDENIGQFMFQDGLGTIPPLILDDLQRLSSQAEEWGIRTPLLSAMIEVNNMSCSWAIETLNRKYPELKRIAIAIWGKGEVIDTSDFIHMLSLGIRFRIYDPARCKQQIEREIENEQVRWSSTCEDSVNGVHGLMILHRTREYLEADLAAIKERMKVPLIIDQQCLFPPGMMKEWGFEYVSVGRKV